MKKRVNILLFILSMAVLFTACNGTSKNDVTNTGKNETNNVEDSGKEEKVIEFWTHYVDDKAFTEKKVAEYNEKMAGKVKVELKIISDDYNNVLLLALKNDDGPDLYADGPNLDQLVQQNYAAPLDEFMSDQMAKQVENFKSLGYNWLDGNWYSFPFRGYNFRLVWNKDMFEAAGLDPEQPPKTYDELRSYAKKLTEYGATQNPQKFGFLLPTGEDWIWWIYGSQMARVNGDSYYDFTTGEFTWEAYKPVMELYLGLQEDGSLFPGGSTMQNDPARAQFSAGNVGMMLAASWDIGVFNDQFPAQIEWGVATLPSIDGEMKGYSQLDCGSYLLINGSSNVKQEAMDFYEYLLSEDTLVEYYESGYGIPVYDGVAQKATTIPDRPGFAGFADVSLDHAYALEPPVQVEGSGYGAVMNNIINGSVDMDTAFADLNKRYNDAIKKGNDNGEFDLNDYIIKDYSTLTPLGK